MHIRQPVIVLLLLAPCYSAQLFAAGEEAELETSLGWVMHLGIGATNAPDYSGSDDIKTTALPILGVEYSQTFFAGILKGVGFNLIKNQPYELSLALGYGGGRDDEGDLSPLDSEDGGLLFNAEASYQHGLLNIFAASSTGLSGDAKGSKLSVGASVFAPLSPTVFLIATVKSAWGNAAWNQSEYGLTAAQAARLGQAPYAIDQGVTQTSYSLTARWAMSSEWSLMLSGSYGKIQDQAAHSPVVDVLGDDEQVGVYAFLTRSWDL